jgi:hypothetical protein
MGIVVVTFVFVRRFAFEILRRLVALTALDLLYYKHHKKSDDEGSSSSSDSESDKEGKDK